jgi:hypothetical protein
MNPGVRTQQLREGDHLQRIRPSTGGAVGIEGTMLHRLAFDARDDIGFDGYLTPRLITTGDRAPAEEKDL